MVWLEARRAYLGEGRERPIWRVQEVMYSCAKGCLSRMERMRDYGATRTY